MLKSGGLRTIVDLFAENVERAPGSPFIRFSDSVCSYAEADRLARGVAGLLQEAGVGYRSRVALALGNRPAFLAALLGALRLGATVVPLNTLYKADEVRYALEHANCAAVLTEPDLEDTVLLACERVGHALSVFVTGAEEGVFDRAAGAPADGGGASRPGPGDLAGIFYTSGTTARPKGVLITHENLVYSAQVTIKSLGLTAADVPLLAFPLFHVNSLFYGVMTAIVLMGSIGLLRGFSVSAYWRDAIGVQATWTPGITGPLARLLLQQPTSGAETAHGLRFAVGGMFTSVEQMEDFAERFGVRLVQGWSMTETVSLGTLHPLERPTPVQGVNGIGYPTLGQEIRLVTEGGREAGIGEPGEILFRSPSLFGGYLDDVAATRAAFTGDGWFRTGDVACMDANGYLAFLDRKKEMIKTRGENVAAAEVERALNEYPGVTESAAIGVPDPEGVWGERVEAYVVAREGEEIPEDRLLAWVSERLADFKVPAALHFVDSLPKTPLGKIQRQRLKQRRSSEAG